MGQSTQIDTFSRFTQVSRETITSLVKYENYLIQSNKTLNLIGKSTINEIWTRHFLDRKISLKVKLIEKSPKKASFLREIVNYLNLNVEVLNINVLTYTKKLEADLIVARAFKPLRIVLQFLDKNTENWKKVFLFLGKTGQSELLQASKSWHIKYKQRMSVTSNDSVVIEINKLKKK